MFSVVLYASETWSMTEADRNRLEAMEMWIWRRMDKISWVDKMRNEEVLQRVNETKTRMWANAQPDGRPAEHRWRPLFNAPKFG